MTEENTQAPAEAAVEAAPQTVSDQITDAVTQASDAPQSSATEDVIVRVEEATAQAVASVPEELTNVALAAAVTGLEIGVEALTEAQAKIDKLTAALENCRTYAARHARREEWARTIGRFCEEAGVTGSPLRG